MNPILTLVMQHLRKLYQEIALGYAWIMLVPSWQAGLIFAALTFIDPISGAVGMLGAITAWYAAHLAGADATERPVCVFNGILSEFPYHIVYLLLQKCAIILLTGEL